MDNKKFKGPVFKMRETSSFLFSPQYAGGGSSIAPWPNIWLGARRRSGWHDEHEFPGKIAEDKEYFNTGTWTELTSLDIVSLGKITKLTYVLIEKTSRSPSED